MENHHQVSQSNPKNDTDKTQYFFPLTCPQPLSPSSFSWPLISNFLGLVGARVLNDGYSKVSESRPSNFPQPHNRRMEGHQGIRINHPATLSRQSLIHTTSCISPISFLLISPRQEDQQSPIHSTLSHPLPDRITVSSARDRKEKGGRREPEWGRDIVMKFQLPVTSWNDT